MTGIKTTSGNWSYTNPITGLILGVLVMALGFALGLRVSATSLEDIEYYTPPIEYGARIPGTNYTVADGDTLEIVRIQPSAYYHYRILNQEQRKQARAYIKTLRK